MLLAVYSVNMKNYSIALSSVNWPQFCKFEFCKDRDICLSSELMFSSTCTYSLETHSSTCNISFKRLQACAGGAGRIDWSLMAAGDLAWYGAAVYVFSLFSYFSTLENALPLACFASKPVHSWHFIFIVLGSCWYLFVQDVIMAHWLPLPDWSPSPNSSGHKTEEEKKVNMPQKLRQKLLIK